MSGPFPVSTNQTDSEKNGLWSGGDTMLAYIIHTTTAEDDDMDIKEFKKR